MNLHRLFLFVLVLALGCRTLSAERSETGTSSSLKPDNPPAQINSTTESETTSETNANKQIDVNKNVLRTSPDEQMRIEVASLLLFNQNPYARQALIETLNLTNNSPARIAICKAFIQARAARQEIPNKDDFIEPLLNIFSTKIDEEARLAADAILIYNYKQIWPLLDKLVTDPEKPVKTRINVIESLKKLWEKEAIIRLYRLIDDADPEVAAEAENALHSLGFLIGTNGSERERIIADIQNKEIIEVLKELLIKQEAQIDLQKTDIESLKKFTLAVLDEAYLGIGIDDASRGKFLNKYLTDSRDSRTWVKSWSLDKVLAWRKTPNTQISAELEPVIIKLISDPSKEIRLKTIGLVGLMQPMRTVDLAPPLLAQFEIEQDDQVKIELLDILGIVCSTALSPTAERKITPETRQRVLGYASDFLAKDEIAKAKIGAKVMKQMLEREGLQGYEIQKHLGQLSDRYRKQKEDPNNTLMSELLNAMVGLAADNSSSKEYARKDFEQFFTEALEDKTDFIRETAIDGLGYINKTGYLKMLREGVSKERSEKARLKIIEFAKDIGGKDDLDWLDDRLVLGTNAESKQAWSAMKKIFGNMEIDVLNDWENRLIAEGSKYNLSEPQKIDFLIIVLSKTPEKNKQRYNEQIANRCFNSGQYEQAVNYFTKLYEAAGTSEEKDRIMPKYMDSCLRLPNEKLAAKLMLEYLSKNITNPENAVIVTIDNYFKDANTTTDKSAILRSLKGIALAQPKPSWQTKLLEWTDLINKTVPQKTPSP